MGQHEAVVVDVDPPGLCGGRLGHFVGVSARRNAGADVEELADAGVFGQVADHPAEEGPVGVHAELDARLCLEHLLPGYPVRREVILTAEPVVINSGRMRHLGIQASDMPGGPG